MEAIASKTLAPDIRNEISRDLVTHMYGFVEKPTSHFCKFVAQRLILKYPFMKDGLGTGYVSIFLIDSPACMEWHVFTLPEESFVVSFNCLLSCREHGRGKYMIVFTTQIGNAQLQMKEKVAFYIHFLLVY